MTQELDAAGIRCDQSLFQLTKAGVCQSPLSLEHNRLYSWHCLAVARQSFIVCVLFICALLPVPFTFIGLLCNFLGCLTFLTSLFSPLSVCQTWTIRMCSEHCRQCVQMLSWHLMDPSAVLRMSTRLIVCWEWWDRFRNMVVLLNPWSLALLLSITIMIWMHRPPAMDIGP